MNFVGKDLRKNNVDIETITGAQAKVDAAEQRVQKYVQSRGENLVTNGTGLLGDKTNFSSFTFDGSQVFAGGGSFFSQIQNSTQFSDELIPVDPLQKYRFSLMAKQNLGIGKAYFGVVSYDIDGKIITPYDFYGSQYPITTLAKELKVGDTEIHLVSSIGFMDNSATPDHRHSIVFWGYKNSFGYEYPAGTYSRTGFYIGWNTSAINRTTHVITLNKPFNVSNPNDAQGIFRVGHSVSPTSSGGSYQYMTASNVTIPTVWTKYEGTIMGTGIGSTSFPHGTGFIKLLFLLNRNTSGGQAGDSTWVNNLEFYNVTKEVTDAEKSTWNGKQNALGFTPENSINKGKVNGFAGLDANAKVPYEQLPSDIVKQADLGNAGYGDMTKAIYDTNGNGIVDRAALSDSVDWANVTGKPTIPTKTSQITNDSSYKSTIIHRGATPPADTGIFWQPT